MYVSLYEQDGCCCAAVTLFVDDTHDGDVEYDDTHGVVRGDAGTSEEEDVSL